MALYQWISTCSECSLLGKIQEPLKLLGLEIDNDLSRGPHIYAREASGSKVSAATRVIVIISRNSAVTHEIQVEVRSSEPMFKKETRCEMVAQKLKALIPPFKQDHQCQKSQHANND